MTRSSRTIVLTLLAGCVLLSMPTAGFAQTESTAIAETGSETQTPPEEVRVLRGDHVRIFGDANIPAGTVLRGDLITIFGDATVDGTVTGDVTVVLGSLTLNGRVKRGTVAVLSDITLGEDSEIEGDFVNVLGNIDDYGADFFRTYSNIPLPGVSFLALLRWFRGVALFLFFVTTLFLASMVPERVRNISREAPHRYFAAIFVGFLGLLLWLLILPLLTATVVGLFLGWPLFLVLSWLGRMSILHWIGERLGLAFGLRLSLLGAIFIAFIPYALLTVGPIFFGGYFGLLIACMFSGLTFVFLDLPGLGLILLTRAGNAKKTRTEPAPPPVYAEPPVPAHPLARSDSPTPVEPPDIEVE